MALILLLYSVNFIFQAKVIGKSCTLLTYFLIFNGFQLFHSTFHTLFKLKITYVSLRLRVQNAVSAQPCVGKLQISLVLLNFLDCNFRLWFETP